MSGGTISGNTANGVASTGGGVSVKSGTFTMSGGTISGNESADRGGGVEVWQGTFKMSGGTISGNTAASNGGGMLVYGGGTFTMSGTALIHTGNDVYLAAGKTITIGGNLTGAPTVARITLASYAAGTQVLDGTGTLVPDNYGRFTVTNTAWTIDNTGKLQ
jgi:hypothetical protein